MFVKLEFKTTVPTARIVGIFKAVMDNTHSQTSMFAAVSAIQALEIDNCLTAGLSNVGWVEGAEDDTYIRYTSPVTSCPTKTKGFLIHKTNSNVTPTYINSLGVEVTGPTSGMGTPALPNTLIISMSPYHLSIQARQGTNAHSNYMSHFYMFEFIPQEHGYKRTDNNLYPVAVRSAASLGTSATGVAMQILGDTFTYSGNASTGLNLYSPYSRWASATINTRTQHLLSMGEGLAYTMVPFGVQGYSWTGTEGGPITDLCNVYFVDIAAFPDDTVVTVQGKQFYIKHCAGASIAYPLE